MQIAFETQVKRTILGAKFHIHMRIARDRSAGASMAVVDVFRVVAERFVVGDVLVERFA